MQKDLRIRAEMCKHVVLTPKIHKWEYYVFLREESFRKIHVMNLISTELLRDNYTSVFINTAVI